MTNSILVHLSLSYKIAIQEPQQVNVNGGLPFFIFSTENCIINGNMEQVGKDRICSGQTTTK